MRKSTTNEIIKEIEKRIEEWKEDREKIANGVFKNHLHNKHIDYSIDDIVIVELLALLKFALARLA